MEPTRTQLARQVVRLTNKIIFLEKKSLLEHGKVKLYPSEIHLLDVIDREPGINASETAARLGVTKGAVSQTVTRLEKKGVVRKSRDRRNKNELTVHLTDLGNEVFEIHRRRRIGLEKTFAGHLDGLSAGDREVIGRFLWNLEGFFENLG
ncbi:MAG: MarR family transcriptional regulator [Proteobacteria bacterium]|nr:MarR family transcriptional regulator [Pseudomonadota bacterium]